MHIAHLTAATRRVMARHGAPCRLEPDEDTPLGACFTRVAHPVPCGRPTPRGHVAVHEDAHAASGRIEDLKFDVTIPRHSGCS